MGGVVKSIKKATRSITRGLLGSDDSAKAAKKIAEAQKQAAAAIARAQEQAANIQRNFTQDLQLENIAQIVPGHEQTATVSDVKKRRRPQIGLASQLGLDL
jgi:Sec-independent protein translocase protein TatA